MLPCWQKYRIGEPYWFLLAIAAVRFQPAQNDHARAINKAIVRIGVVVQIVGNNQGRVRFVHFLELACNVPRTDGALVPSRRLFAMQKLEQGSTAREKAQHQQRRSRGPDYPQYIFPRHPTLRQGCLAPTDNHFLSVSVEFTLLPVFRTIPSTRRASRGKPYLECRYRL